MLESQSQKVTDQNNFTSNQDRYFATWAAVGEVVLVLLGFAVSILSSAAAATVAKRLTLLAEGGWLPGMGDARTIAGLTNHSDRTIEDVASDSPRRKHRVGRKVFYRLSEFAQPRTSDAE